MQDRAAVDVETAHADDGQIYRLEGFGIARSHYAAKVDLENGALLPHDAARPRSLQAQRQPQCWLTDLHVAGIPH